MFPSKLVSKTLRGATALALGTAIVTSAAIGGAQSDGPDIASKPTTTTARPIDINTASATELEALPGVGPSRAQAIVDARTRMKGFQRVEDLMRVKGIGRKTFRELRPLVTVGPKPKATARQAGT